MLDPKKTHDLDQAQTLLTEFLPGLWWNMYKNLQKVGFTEPQAMDILKTYIHASNLSNRQ